MGKEGTGLPGPMMSFLKELSSIPGIRNIAGKDEKGYNKFSVFCSKLFNGTMLGEYDNNGNIIKGGELKFDLRTELGIGHEALISKQHLPVALNELLVRGFYSVRRFLDELKDNAAANLDDLSSIDPSLFLPWKSRALTHMLMLSAATFSVIDITCAGVKAALKNKGNKSGFAVDFIQGINFFGTGRLTVAAGSELGIGVAKLYEKYMDIVTVQLARTGFTYDDVTSIAVNLVNKARLSARVGTPAGYVEAALQVYKEISVSLKELQLAKENRMIIEKRCKADIELIMENRERINRAVSEYMGSHLAVFSDAFDRMENAIKENNVDGYIAGNKMIQRKLGKEDSFENMSEFDALMTSDDNFKL